jgi:GrpB-like predicted nucleotidyltransferase (UPF0157 family)
MSPAVEIVRYRGGWPKEFATIAARLRAGLSDLALRIDHIGSTSVPGLAAKDVIDVQITVAELDEQAEAAMRGLGYRRSPFIRGGDHRPPEADGPDTDWQKWFFDAPAGQRRTNTHMRVHGRPNQRYALLFRDYLRAHPKTAPAYARLTRQLAENLADADTYPDVKDPAVDLIFFAAEDWAIRTHWQPGPSDG